VPLKAGYLLLAAGGGVFIWSGLKNKSVSSAFRQLAGGDSPTGATTAGLGVSGVTPTAAPGTTVGGAAATGLTGINPGGLPGQAGSTVASYQAYAFSLFPSYGWGADQEGPLIDLWNRESGWSVSAKNPSSGAYGIPQALPASKMASAGSDWETNPATQIKWGLGYIKATYGSPAEAWAHEEAEGWY
jgi:resuscitation-promoting factor RpfB